MLLTGVGPRRAERALAARLARGLLPDLVVSSGFAGALSPTLALSSWITAARLGEWDGVARVAVEGVALVEAFAGLVGCEVLSSGALLSASSVGASAGATDATMPIAVDMESVALARGAATKGVPFAVVRLVSDTPAHPLPPFLSPFTSALAATSHAARVTFAARGLRAALADPRAVARLLADGPTWLRRLEDGWRSFAQLRT
jgi:nucleoside phosphorylase